MNSTVLLLFVVAAATPRADLAAELERRGIEAFETKQYCDAAHLFEASDELLPSSSMIYNSGRAYEAEGDLLGAHDAYRQALAALEDAARRSELEARIAELRATIERSPEKAGERCPARPADLSREQLLSEVSPQEVADGALAASTEPKGESSAAPDEQAANSKESSEIGGEAPPGPGVEPSDDVAAAHRAEDVAATEPTSPASDSTGGLWMGWWGVGGVGVGAAIVAVGVVSWLVALAIHLSVPAEPSVKQVADAAAIGRPFEYAGFVIGGTGLAVMGAGALAFSLLLLPEE